MYSSPSLPRVRERAREVGRDRGADEGSEGMASDERALLADPGLADAGRTELVSLDPSHFERHVVGVVGGCGRDRQIPRLRHRHVVDRRRAPRR